MRPAVTNSNTDIFLDAATTTTMTTGIMIVFGKTFYSIVVCVTSNHDQGQQGGRKILESLVTNSEVNIFSDTMTSKIMKLNMMAPHQFV